MTKSKTLISILASFIAFSIGMQSNAEEKVEPSRIVSVKLYQNQAEIMRSTKLALRKGNNTVILGGLPEGLYDWSARGKLPLDFMGKILSLEVEKKALINKRQKNILEIEEKLKKLREKDEVLLDDLKNIKSQEEFLDSILAFTNQTVSKELATRIPQVSVWDNTLNYVTKKRNELLKKKRETEREREELGKEIQKWEFELSQIAGYNYFQNYQTLNKVILENRSSMNVQQFANITSKYAERDSLLKRPTEKVDIEKRFVVDIFSSKDSEVEISFSYVIPNTYWQMQYDFRASSEEKNIDLVVYGNIYQKTGEDWNDVALTLSTGSPVNAIAPPDLSPWYLDVYTPPVYKDYKGGAPESAKMKRAMKQEAESYQGAEQMREEEAAIPQSTISGSGPYFEIAIPLKQTIVSSNKYQKKMIKDYALSGGDSVNFYYELTPEESRSSYLRVKAANKTDLPWLSGESQIFLENEFMGKVQIPYTPAGKEEDFILGMESRITGKKELVKKYEDEAGVFGGNRRILCKYRIEVENLMPQETEIVVKDMIPVSRNEKIGVLLQNLSLPFMKDGEFEKSADYERGIRKWKINLGKKESREISYEVVITFDRDVDIKGLR